MNVEVKVYYKGFDLELDNAIKEKLRSLGMLCWSQGRDVPEGIRDILFDWPEETIFRKSSEDLNAWDKEKRQEEYIKDLGKRLGPFPPMLSSEREDK